VIQSLALIVLPAFTFSIGLLTQKDILWAALFFLVASIIYFALSARKSTSSEEQVWWSFFRAFAHGATLVGQLACVGILALWFL